MDIEKEMIFETYSEFIVTRVCEVSGSVIDKKIHLSHFNMSLNCMGEFRVHVKRTYRACMMRTPSFCVFRRVLAPWPLSFQIARQGDRGAVSESSAQ